MLSIDLIRENLTRSEEIVLSRIEDMREQCMVFPTRRGGYGVPWGAVKLHLPQSSGKQIMSV